MKVFEQYSGVSKCVECENKHCLFGAEMGLNFHSSFQNEMARYSSNLGNKLQMMVGIGKELPWVPDSPKKEIEISFLGESGTQGSKEYGFTLNFYIPWPFTHRKTELPRKMLNSQSDCRTASCIPE